MRRTHRLVLVGLVVAFLLGVMVFSMEMTSTRLTPEELVSGDYDDERVTIEGTVRDVAIGSTTEFVVAGNRSAKVPVRMTRSPPATLEDGRIVIVEGVYRDGVLEASSLQVRSHEGTEPPDSVTE